MKTRSSCRNDGPHDNEVASDGPASQPNVRSQQSRAAPNLIQQVEPHTKVNRESSQPVELPKNHRHDQGAQAHAQKFANGRQSLNPNANHADGEKRPQHSSLRRPQQHPDDLFTKSKHRRTSIGRTTPSNAHSQFNQHSHDDPRPQSSKAKPHPAPIGSIPPSNAHSQFDRHSHGDPRARSFKAKPRVTPTGDSTPSNVAFQSNQQPRNVVQSQRQT